MALSYTAPTAYGGTAGGGGGAQRSDFFKTNTYEDAYKDFVPYAQGYATKFLDRSLSKDPFGAGGQFTTPGGFSSQFGFSSLNPNDPRIPKFQANLMGAQRNAVNENASRMANAGIAGSRSGMGIRGVPDMRSAALRSGNEVVAGNAGNAYSQAVDWTRDAAGLDNAAAQAMAQLYGQMYSTDVDAGGNFMNMVLQALTSKDASKMQWAQMMADAYGLDVSDANRLREGQRSWDWAAADRQKQQTAEQEARNAQFNNDSMLRQLSVAGGAYNKAAPGVNTGLDNYVRLAGLSPYWMAGNKPSTDKRSMLGQNSSLSTSLPYA